HVPQLSEQRQIGGQRLLATRDDVKTVARELLRQRIARLVKALRRDGCAMMFAFPIEPLDLAPPALTLVVAGRRRDPHRTAQFRARFFWIFVMLVHTVTREGVAGRDLDAIPGLSAMALPVIALIGLVHAPRERHQLLIGPAIHIRGV